MVQIGWEQCDIAKVFQHDFQKVALCANLSTPLFKEETTQIEEVTNNDGIIEDMEPDTCITTIMQQSLEMAAEIIRLHGARVSSLKDAARKMYVQSAQRETKQSFWINIPHLCKQKLHLQLKKSKNDNNKCFKTYLNFMSLKEISSS